MSSLSKEEQYKRTIISSLQFDSVLADFKEALLKIFTRSTLNFLPQWGFVKGGRSYQRYEDIELRVPIPLINLANQFVSDIKKVISYVYVETDEYALGDIFIKPQLIESDDEPEITNNAEFNEIQETIIQGIRDAKYLIWVAVAWFTNEVYARELYNKKKQGINIRIIISDENSNKKLEKGLKEAFDCKVIPHSGINGLNRMHDKFCIVDLDYVMHGSYNWTKSADYNHETWVTTADRNFVRQFADEFQKMYIS